MGFLKNSLTDSHLEIHLETQMGTLMGKRKGRHLTMEIMKVIRRGTRMERPMRMVRGKDFRMDSQKGIH